MGLFDFFKKANKNEEKREEKPVQPKNTLQNETEYIDDITYIRAIKHTLCGAWNQYDILLASRIYGWDYMTDCADYISTNEFKHTDELCVGDLALSKNDITQQFVDNGRKVKDLKVLENERGYLSIAGLSKTLRAPVKIVYINQTNTMRLFTLSDDEDLIRRYVETLIRRTFGTEDAMKSAKPIPEGQ